MPELQTIELFAIIGIGTVVWMVKQILEHAVAEIVTWLRG